MRGIKKKTVRSSCFWLRNCAQVTRRCPMGSLMFLCSDGIRMSGVPVCSFGVHPAPLSLPSFNISLSNFLSFAVACSYEQDEPELLVGCSSGILLHVEGVSLRRMPPTPSLFVNTHFVLCSVVWCLVEAAASKGSSPGAILPSTPPLLPPVHQAVAQPLICLLGCFDCSAVNRRWFHHSRWKAARVAAKKNSFSSSS